MGHKFTEFAWQQLWYAFQYQKVAYFVNNLHAAFELQSNDEITLTVYLYFTLAFQVMRT